EAIAVVMLLCGAMLLTSSCGMVDVMLAMTGPTTWNLANVSIAVALNLGLNLLLIGKLGIVGAAVAWTAAIALKNLLPLAQLARRGLHPYGRGTVTAAALAMACFGVLPTAAGAVFGWGLPVLATAVTVGTACYLTGLWRLRDPLNLTALHSMRASARPIVMEMP
ncbi:MAG: polysaccharide biosynthesis C-terminal domain-containing protein, partial [Micromonosporaceae bacterium]